MVDSVKNMSGDSCKMVADFFSVYANETRMNILCLLSDGPKTVSQLSESIGVSLPNISQHLRVIRNKGAVISEKDGQNVFYSIGDQEIIKGIKIIRDSLLNSLKKKVAAIE